MSEQDGGPMLIVAQTVRRPKVQSIASQVAYVACIATMNVVIVRAWGTAERGDVAMVSVVATLAATLGGVGLTDVLVWAGSIGSDARDVGARYRRSVLTTIVVGTISACVLALLLSDEVGLLVLPWAVSLHLFRASMSTRLASADFTRFNLSRTALPVLSTVAVGAGALSGRGHPAAWAVGGQIIAAVLLFDRRSPQLQPRGRLRGSAPGERSVAIQSVIGNVAGLSLTRMDVLIVAGMLTSVDAGRYAVALAVGDGAMVASLGLMFHAMHEGATHKGVSRRTLGASIGSTVVLCLAAVIGLRLGAGSVLGPQFEDIDRTFALLVPGVGAMSYLRLRYAGDLTGGTGGRATGALVGAIVVMIVVDLLLVPAHGIEGAAAGSSIAYAVAAASIMRRVPQSPGRAGAMA